VRLKLDSGSNASILYNPRNSWRWVLPKGGRPRVGGDGVQRKFTILPPQDVKIGSLAMDKVSFLTPTDSETNPQLAEIDGLVATSRFRSVFIDHTDRFAVLNHGKRKMDLCRCLPDQCKGVRFDGL